MRILWLSPISPFPPTDGNRMRNFYLIKNLSVEHEIILIHFYTVDDVLEVDNPLCKYCKSVEGIEIDSKSEKSLLRLVDKIWNELLGKVTFCGYSYRKEMKKKVLSFCAMNKIDVIIAVSPWMGEYVVGIKNVPMVLDNQNVETFLLKGIFKAEKKIKIKIAKYLDYLAMIRYEPKIIKSFDVMTVVSKEDKDVFLSSGFNDSFIKIIPNGVQILDKNSEYSGNSLPGLIFCGGMSYPPNVEGVNYFMVEIYPRIKIRLPNFKVYLVGKCPHPDIMRWQSEIVEVTGFVTDVLPYYRRSSVSIVPLKTGSGTRLKILESMALGIPVVSTTIGASGLSVTNNENIIIRDDPDAFADSVVSLIKNESLARAISLNARKLVEANYDWHGITEKLNLVLSELQSNKK